MLVAKTIAGVFPNGGAPMNCDDFLVVTELKSYSKETKVLKDKKKDVVMFQGTKAIPNNVSNCFNNLKPLK